MRTEWEVREASEKLMSHSRRIMTRPALQNGRKRTKLEVREKGN
jgi:hypothetical protein